MNFIMALITGIGLFIRRNPITCFVILILAITAPALMKGVAMFILYLILGIITLIAVVLLMFRWRIHKMRKRMGDQFNSQGGFNQNSGFGGNKQSRYNSEDSSKSEKEGDVKISKTTETPEKKVNSRVGDYVEFEETKD